MKNRLTLIVPTLLLLIGFNDVIDTSAATDVSETEVLLRTDTETIIDDPILENTIYESPPAEAATYATMGLQVPASEDSTYETSPPETNPTEITNPDPETSETNPTEITNPDPATSETNPTETTEPDPATSETNPIETTEPDPATSETNPIETTEPDPATSETNPIETTEPDPATSETNPIETTEPDPATSETNPIETTEPDPATSETNPIETTEPDPATSETNPIETTEPDPATPETNPTENTDLDSTTTEFATQVTTNEELSTSNISLNLQANSMVSEVINQIETDQKVIALTFDDGDSDEFLSDIINNLNELDVKGTFFLNGWANADLMKKLVADGHQLANHGYSHATSTMITSEKLESELNMMEEYILDTTGTSSLPYFRAPHGLYNDSVLETAGSLGYKYTLGWSIDTYDWTENSQSEISSFILDNVHPGAIVLMHANTAAINTADSLWYTISSLREAGYTFATVEELLELGGYLEEEPILTIPSQMVTKVNTNDKTIALTFDDGNSSINIQTILDELDNYGIKATFFLDGETDPTMIAKIAAAGHEIGNHTYSHYDSTLIDGETFKSELNRMDEVIQNATGVTSKPFFRAPYGYYNDSVLESAGSLGYTHTIGWTSDPRDWSGISASEISTKVTSSLTPGGIYLLHASNEAIHTPAALPSMLSSIIAQGYKFATISQLLALEGVVIVDPPLNPNADPSEVINRVITTDKTIALTFDDGNSSTNIQAVLNELNAFGIKATFFLDGSADPEMIAAIAAAGHEIGNHTYSHFDTTLLNEETFRSELSQMENIIQSATGVSSKPYFRTPYGYYNESVLQVAGSMGYSHTIGWSLDTRDWSGISANEISTKVINALAPGGIYLLHASNEAINTPAALPSMLSSIIAQGYKFATISQLLGMQGTVPVDPNENPSDVVTKVVTNNKAISLTISDVTDQNNLTAILNNLAATGVKATFFVAGTANESFITQIAAAGHQIGNQSYSHVYTTELTSDQLAAEITAMENIIFEASGTTTKPFFRAPFGVTNASVLNTVGALGYEYTIGWTTDTRDWTGSLSASQISSAVTSNLSPGSIYLLHANAAATATPEALLSIISTARENGYSFETISGLISLGSITTDPNADSSKVINRVITTDKTIALTFDDGNSSTNIQAVLNELNAFGIKATFFLDGSADPEMIAAIAAAGHEIGNHTYSHFDTTLLNEETFRSELSQMENIIQSATGVSSKPYFRTPYGYYNESVLQVAGSMGYSHTVGWSLDTRDWSGISANEISTKVINALAPGGIYLLHASNEAINTPAALPSMLSSIIAQGYKFATISQLLGMQGTVPVDPNANPSDVVTKVVTNNKAISLTISDVTDQNNLTAILNNLAATGVKATFFVAGTANESFITQIAAAGHQIGNQSYSHVYTTELTSDQLAAEITAMENIIFEASGTTTKPFFRAPFGVTNASVLNTVGALGYEYTIGWTTDTRDWTGSLSASQISSAVTSNLSPGSIYLLHANAAATATPEALLSIISTARENGYSFETISDLLALDNSSEEPNDFKVPNLIQYPNASNPVITIEDITDRYDQTGAADPFIMLDNGTYYIFFEIIGGKNTNNGYAADEIAFASSSDLTNWNYGKVILGDEIHGTRAAYPSIFKYEDEYYMVPDRVDDIQAYVASDFPLEWEYYSTLLEGTFVDSNVFEVDGTWYLTTSEHPFNSVSLYYNDSGDWRNSNWQLHPTQHIIKENDNERGYRGAGNPFVYEDYVVMPVQVTPTGTNVYGEYTDWYKISNLSSTTVTVENLGRALTPTYDGSWIGEAIHHISHAPYGDGYIYAIDGYANNEYKIGLYIDFTQQI